jgi:hypothetical protein
MTIPPTASACRIRTGLLLSVVLFLFLFPLRVCAAAEAAFLAGGTWSPEAAGITYGWQLDTRYNFQRPFAISVSWINEGHFPDHHRDGLAAQLWGRSRLLRDRLSFAFGAGVYQYFDTQNRPASEHDIGHGVAPVFSASASYYTENPWFFRLSVNHIHPMREIDTTAVLFGMGYRLYEEAGKRPFEPPDAASMPVPDRMSAEAAFLLGAVIHNNLEDKQGFSGEFEFRRGIARNFDLTLSLIGEDDREEIRRTGLACQIWVVDAFLDRRLMFGIGAGPYPFIDWVPTNGSDSRIDFAGLVTLATGYRLTERWIARFHWNRVATRDERDTDMFIVGLGYRWNR